MYHIMSTIMVDNKSKIDVVKNELKFNPSRNISLHLILGVSSADVVSFKILLVPSLVI